MSVFVDQTLLNFTQDAFVADVLTNGVGLTPLFNATFETADIAVDTIALGPVSPRSYKVPVFETVRSTGTEERIVPDQQRVRHQRNLPRFGRLEWVDVAFDTVLATTVTTLVAPLQSITTQSLVQKLGGVATIAELRTKLLTLYAPSIVDDIFARLRISTIEDFARQHHLFVELVGAAPPPADPADPAASRSFTVAVRVKIADGFDVAGALQSAKLCRSILENESIPDQIDGVERVTPFALLTLFANAAVTDASLPGRTAAQSRAAVGTLFAGERMFAHFIN